MSETVGAGIEVCGLTVTITVAGANNVLTANDCELAVFGIVRSCLGELQELEANPTAVVERVIARVNGDKPVATEQVFTCNLCARSFDTLAGRTIHMSWHSRRQNYATTAATTPARPTEEERARRIAQAEAADRRRAEAARAGEEKAKSFAVQMKAEHDEWLSKRKPTEQVLACKDCGDEHEVSNTGALTLSLHVQNAHARTMHRTERTPRSPAASP